MDRKDLESLARNFGKDKVQVLIDNHFQWNPPLAVLPLLFPSDEVVSEFFKTYKFTTLGRETIEGREVIRLAFRQKSEPSPKQERAFPQLAGELWATDEGNLVRVSAEIVDSTPMWMTFGPIKLTLGNARGHKITVEYKMVDSVWLPARFETRMPEPVAPGFSPSTMHTYTDFKKYRAEATFRLEDGQAKD